MKKVYRDDPNGHHEIIQSSDGGYSWVSEDEEHASTYAETENAENPTVEKFYFKPKRELDLTGIDTDAFIAEKNEAGEYVPTQALLELASATGIDAQTLLEEESNYPYTEDDVDAEHLWSIIKRPYFAKLLQEKGYDGVRQIESGVVTHGFLDSTQVKSATDNNGTFNENDPRFRYEISSESDAEFLRSVNTGDIGTAQRMVNDVAKRLGMARLFHGSKRYGFTKFGTSLVFAVPDVGVAESYTAGHEGTAGVVRRLSDLLHANDTDEHIFQNAKILLGESWHRVNEEDRKHYAEQVLQAVRYLSHWLA